jgi:2-haloacid dehalogenase
MSADQPFVKGQNMPQITTVIFDIGRVLFEWDLRHLFAKLIDDEGELDWFLANVITPEWHFQHDAGRPLAEMIPERIAEFPGHADLIRAYQSRFNETIPGPVPGSLEIVRELAAKQVPLFAITNFGAEFWEAFRPTQPIFDHFRDIIGGRCGDTRTCV